VFRFTGAIILVVCLCHELVSAQTYGLDVVPRDDLDPPSLFPISYAEFEGIRQDLAQATKRTLSLELGPKLVEVKAFYLEKRQDSVGPAISANDSAIPKWGSYFDLLATSSQFGGRLIGEGELAYSTLGLATESIQQPMMSRLALKGSWGKASYGLQHRSFGTGFVSMAGAKIDHELDERQLWGEYAFDSFSLKGLIGESREKNTDTNELTLTKTAGTQLNLSKGGWNALLSSTYSLSGQGQRQQTDAFTNALSIAYHPMSFLTIEPGFSVKKEWDRNTGSRTDTPSAGFALICSPDRDLQFTSRASYARGVSEDSLKENSTLNTSALLNWKIGKSFLGEQSLSVQVEYKHVAQTSALNSSQPNLTGLVQWKVAGF
jgi:hypothetical protein